VIAVESKQLTSHKGVASLIFNQNCQFQVYDMVLLTQKSLLNPELSCNMRNDMANVLLCTSKIMPPVVQTLWQNLP
jgi:hypothetical protein